MRYLQGISASPSMKNVDPRFERKKKESARNQQQTHLGKERTETEAEAEA